MTENEYVRSWLLKAEQDMKTAAQLTERPRNDWVPGSICFHCQQAIEKALKALLISRRVEPEKTRNLELLAFQCRKVSPGFQPYDFRNLTFYAVEARYPDDQVVPDNDEITFYVDLAKQVIADIKKITHN